MGPVGTKIGYQQASTSGSEDCGASRMDFQSNTGMWAPGCIFAAMGCCSPLLSWSRCIIRSPQAETTLPLPEPFLGKEGSAPNSSAPLKDGRSPSSLHYYPESGLTKGKLEEINIIFLLQWMFFFVCVCQLQDISLPKHAAHESSSCPWHIGLQRLCDCTEPCTCPEHREQSRARRGAKTAGRIEARRSWFCPMLSMCLSLQSEHPG